MGEIEVRGSTMYSGYLNRADATAAARTADGWFRTGDVATRSADGYVSILGRRATDLIKSGGFKIGAGEIEDALLGHPGVAEAAVVGVPDVPFHIDALLADAALVGGLIASMALRSPFRVDVVRDRATLSRTSCTASLVLRSSCPPQMRKVPMGFQVCGFWPGLNCVSFARPPA